MQLSPDEFWGMSLQEFYAACDGVRQFNSSGEKAPLTRNELQDLMERYPD